MLTVEFLTQLKCNLHCLEGYLQRFEREGGRGAYSPELCLKLRIGKIFLSIFCNHFRIFSSIELNLVPLEINCRFIFIQFHQHVSSSYRSRIATDLAHVGFKLKLKVLILFLICNLGQTIIRLQDRI